ncbi:MAG TPA: ATP-dependent RNA helicase [Spirochaetes bacterium]|nr:ATP-dependent RNA helicase [Spirochaetota bacterium]
MDTRKLPVYEHKDIIVAALKRSSVVVVESPTGSGKTTQIPKILYDAGFAKTGKIGVTQPRRISTLSVSAFIARQHGVEIPGLVGYKMRFVDETVPDTKIVIMTDGILLQALKTDPTLSEYSVIMVDEAHERSLNIDFILGLLKSILKNRDDLKIIISSATINARIFSEYFDGCPVVSIDARMYPVTLLYEPVEAPHDFQAILSRIGRIVKKIVTENESGDMLIFLSGEGQIKECVSYLTQIDKKKKMALLPLYGRLSQAEQEKVFLDFPGKRKVIVSTNVAETSVTIDGINYIIDPGYGKLNYYNTRNFTSSLIEVPISRASCNQRKGRAGRTGPGSCYRLYTEDDYESRPLFTTEEIYRRDLSEVILRMAELGIKDFEQFDFISNPGFNNIKGAVRALRLLEALDEQRDLTSIGKMMVNFPIIPRLSRIIIAAIMEYPDVIEEVLIAASFLNGRAPFQLPHGFELEARKAHHSFQHKLGDFVSYLKIYRSYVGAGDHEEFCARYYLDYKGMVEIYNVKRQLEEIVSGLGVPIVGGGDISNYLSAVAKGLIQFVCKKVGKGGYSSLTAYGIKIHPGSVMYRKKPDFIVAGEIVKTSQMYARSVSPLSPELLRKIFPELYSAFVQKGASQKKKIVSSRDFTNYIKIGTEKFEIALDKKKNKIVILPFEKLRKVISGVDPVNVQDYKGLRGKVVVEGYELLRGMSLSRILSVVPKLQGMNSIVEKWPRGIHYEYMRDAYELLRFLPNLLFPCKKSGKNKYLGFLTLITDGGGNYWYSGYRDYIQALEESVSSLESLTDEDINILTGEQEARLNEAYRRLMELLED